MYSRMDKYHGQKVQRFSIRKYSFGAASVAVAAYMMFGGAATVQAHEQGTSATVTSEQVNPNAGNQADSTKPVDSTETSASTVATPTTEQAAAPVTATPAPEVAPAEPTKAVEAPVAKADTSKLEAAIARLEAALEKASSTEKTASAIESAKAELTKAQALLSNDKATQEEVDYSTSSLKNRAFVLESMPKATADKKEEKENKNQDPRNGQAIPGKGESGFRAVDTTAANAASEAEKYKGIRDAAIPELQANIDKIQAQIAKEEAKPTNKKDQFKIDVLKGIKQKAENVITTANAADTTSAQKMSQQAEAVKSERDLLALYLAGKADLGAPVSENHVAYGNNPTNGVFESLKEGFGDKVTFDDVATKSETIAKQQAGPGDINAHSEGIGSATYNWKEKTITKADAETGVLNGWKIENGEKVTAVKPLDVTKITDKDGALSTRTVPKSKIYTNDGELIKYQREGHQLSYNAGSGIIPTITPTIDAMRTNAFGQVKNRDYYLELGSKGTTISKEFDVNGNSRLNVNLIHSAAYGHSSTPSTGEKVKLKIVDAFTGEEIKPVDGKNGPVSTEAGPAGGNGWSSLARIYDIPSKTTKIKVLIEAADQGTGLTTNPFNRKGAEIKDGYLVGGIGIATAPAAEIVTDVTSGRNKNEYGYTPDTIYDKNQKGSFNFTLKDTAGMNIDYYAASKVQVTVKVPKGVILEDRVINANGGNAFLGGVYANSIRWTPNDPNDNSKGGTLTYDVPADKRMAAAEKTTRSSSIVFTTADNFIGPANFKVTAKSGFGDTDAEGNRLYSYTTNGLKPEYENQFHRGGLANSDQPDFEYGKVIYINSLQATGTVTVPINTNDDQLKEVAYAKAQEEVNSANFQQLLRDMNATAAMGQITNVTLNSKDKVEITKIAADGRGVVKVPITYTADGKTYDTTVDIEVNVVKSTTAKLVVLEGDKITNDQVKSSVTPATIDTKAGVVNNPNEADVFSTVGKVGQADLKIPTTVTHNSNGTNINETVEVPVTVLPKATGEVEVHKGASVDKVKELAKAKATEVATSADFKAKLPVGSKDVVVGEITEEVLAKITSEKGTNKGTVKVPVTYTVDGTSYTREAEITVNVVGSEPKTVYTVEGKKLDAEKVKNAVTPGTGGTVNAPKETDLPATTVKAGTPDVTVPTTVTYPTGDETVNVPVEVLPKATPEKVTTLKDTTSENLTTAVKEKAQAALGKLTLPTGVTAELVPNQDYTVPATDSNGDKENVPVKVQYKDATGTVVAEDTINVPVTVVSSTPSKIVVFEGEEVTADAVKGAVTPGTDGTKGTPVIPADLTKQSGEKEVTLPVAYDGITDPEQVKVPVTVLPKPEADEILVAKNSDKEKAKEKILAQAKKAIEDATFKGKLPQGATVTVDNTVPVTIPELTNDTEVEVTVKYTVNGEEKKTTVKVPVTIVEGVPQIVPVKENNDVLPDPEKSIDKTDYPEGSTFRYKTPDGQTTPIDVTTPGDKDVIVEVLDKNGNPIAEVPATVRVVESYPKYVPVDPAKKQPDPKDNINPNDFPTGTTFEYKDNTPVDTTTPGEKPVTVVAKLNGQPITEIPATIVVVEPKTQYVPVNAEGDKKPKPQDSITPDDYPEGSTFEYKTPEGQTTPYDGTTPGEKDVTVVVKDPDGDKLVEVPAKIKVVQGKEQLTPVNAEDKDKPKAEDSITPSDYPEGSTFEYKVPEGQTTPYDGTTPGDKPVTVVVKDKKGNVLVEVPATIKVVESKPTPIETPVTTTPLTQEDYTKGMKIPEGATVKVGDLPDLTTPGEKTPVKVTITLPNGKSYTVDVPVTVTPVKEIETPVTTGKLTPEDILKQVKVPEGATTKVENIPDLTTPGKKDPVKVTIELPNGKVVTVDVPVNVTPVKEIETPVTTTPLTQDDYTKGITIPEGGKITNVENIPDLTTPGKKDPVKVTIELPNGKVITVDVPVTVTPVKEIETPVTTGKLTPEDILKQIKVPEGATTKVKNIPDLTTPGKKDPVKVTITLPNGKVVTVDVPVTVTPVKEIETPVTKEKLTPEDILKQIKVPEGATTKVENIPDLTTPGKKDPVKVTITLPNGKVVTVDVPVNVTPIKEIETPVTTDKLTPEDILKQIKVPEGATVKVGDLPDLTTPGKKDPVKVTVTLPNGKVVTVEVPVNVTPITPIETLVTKDKLTPEDILKQIKVPEGATVKVGDLPDLTTPGKKDPVKVTITLPNGKVVTVEIPVTVTPIEDIVKKQGDPITTEDVEKHIPKGAKVISIGDKPTTDVPGERPSIPVVIELPNGIRVTVNVPVIVTPKVTPVVVKVGTPVTPEDVKKHIELPNGWKVTKVGEIPTTETPGTKPVVKVEIELPDGRKITVDIPVIVTPAVRQIVVPQGTPITPDDVKGHIDLPKEPGWEIVEVGEIPTTIPAGEKPSVKVKVKVPTGEIIEIDVPVIVTPKVTPIVVEVGTPITENDVKKRIDLPEGWEIVEVGEIPTTETPGTKPVVKVKVKLPDGRIITVEVPVTVTPKSQNGGGVISQNGDSTVQIVTEYLDENGNRITSDKEGKHNPIELEGYEFSHSTTDAKGNTLHHYKKVGTAPSEVETPRHQEQPTTPTQPAVPTPAETSVPTDSATQPATPKYVEGQKELPNTGTEANASLAALGLLGALSGFGLLARKKKED